MRTTVTLLFIALFTSLQAQAPGDSLHLFFDDASDDLVLDSIYPAGCWQVGTPSKTVFTSAYSPGRALVTDTVAPYPENTACYAEFSLVATNFEYLGRSLLFQQRRDMDSTTVASIEVMSEWDTEWHRFGMGWDEWLTIDNFGQPNDGNGYTFTGSSNGWEEVWLESPCIGVLVPGEQRGLKWYSQVMRVRLVFESQGNANGHDGWMIDNVRAGVSLCTGSVEETPGPELMLIPNPADRYAEIRTTGGALQNLEIIAADGRLVHAGQLPASPVDVLDLGAVENGLYMLRAHVDGKFLTTPLVVRH
jgi:hypothetical protein